MELDDDGVPSQNMMDLSEALHDVEELVTSTLCMDIVKETFDNGK